MSRTPLRSINDSSSSSSSSTTTSSSPYHPFPSGTPFPDLNDVLGAFLAAVRPELGPNFLGM